MKNLALICALAACAFVARASVVLSHFEFEPGNNQVAFTWGTSSETDNYYFQFIRNGTPLYQTTGHVTTTQPHEYAWTDNGAPNETVCHYLFRCASSTTQDTLLSFTVLPPHWVALGTVSAHGTAEAVQISWTTLSEVHSARFDIVRNGITVGSVPGHGVTTSLHTYFWPDTTVSAGMTYTYVLWAVKTDSSRDSLGTASITLDAHEAAGLHPSAFSLSAFPNPFNPVTTVSFALPAAQYIRVGIYDIEGRERQRVAGGIFSAGEHHLIFDASSLPSGVYFARLSGSRVNATVKLLLLR